MSEADVKDESVVYDYLNEKWVTCAMFPNYEISDMGRVRKAKTGGLIKGYFSKDDKRLKVHMRGPNRRDRLVQLNHLVAEAFLPDFDSRYEVDFISGNYYDLRAVNLTMSHKRRRGPRPKS